MEYKDYYNIMGVPRTAQADEIKRAYRKLARKYHPDVSKESGAEEKFKELGEAYEVLKDPQKRAAYDQLGANWQAGQEFRPPPGWAPPEWEGVAGGAGGFGDASDFFEFLFGGGQGGMHRSTHRHGFARRGEDYHSKIQISLPEAYHGGVKEIQLTGQQGQRRLLKVKIPPGIKSGQQIRLPHQGAPGMGKGEKGDLYLEIEVQKHPFFDMIGNDIYCSLPVTPWEAALGATVTVPTLGGKVGLKIPPGSQGGQKLRLKGRGLPGTKGGDQYVILKIVIPQPATDSAKALYTQMAQEMPFNPREHIDG